MGSFFENISMTAAVSACSMLVSLLALFYARKNLKMQKYIDVVTAQRIKWIGELRADFSAILSYVYVSTFADELADHWEFCRDENFEDYDDEWYYTLNDNIAKLRQTRSSVLTPKNNAEFIRRIDLCILKLNRSDSKDFALLQELEKLKLVPFGDYEKGKLDKLLIKIRDMMGEILKDEWDRVKKEVRKGGLVNGKRKKIFD